MKLLRQTNGVVIIAVLWICALITWIAFEIGADTRLRSDEEAHLLKRSQALFLAMGGVNEALARMGTPAPVDFDAASEAAWQPDGNPQVVHYLTGDAVVIIEDENQKVNVNNADHAQLQEVLETADVASEDASSLADMIQDFIDPDDTPRMHGAERDQYKARGIPYAPFNAPLTSVDQLLLVPGISTDLFYQYTELAPENNRGDKKKRDTTSKSDTRQGIMVPGKDSLFEMFTVYGTNTALQKKDRDTDSIFEKTGKQQTGQSSFLGVSGSDQENAQREVASWTPGGIYRILSCGRGSSGVPVVTVCLIVRYAPETQTGYEVLYSNVL